MTEEEINDNINTMKEVDMERKETKTYAFENA
jgi:hypothetical protein